MPFLSEACLCAVSQTPLFQTLEIQTISRTNLSQRLANANTSAKPLENLAACLSNKDLRHVNS